jgi:SAM-dependent methyltransferase
MLRAGGGPMNDRREEIRRHNRVAWDRQVEHGNPWTVPVGPEVIAAARRGEWHILLTPTVPVPPSWFPELAGLEVLCLASGGGQQGPILAAAGARVTVLDDSTAQLERDRQVAAREGLEITTVAGDMAHLRVFDDERFGLVVHPVSNCFVPDVIPVWAEAYRVLADGGILLAGFNNPLRYLFDEEVAQHTGELRVVNRLPYSDLETFSEQDRRRRLERGEPLEFGHTLEQQIGGQLEAGFVLTGLYEDHFPDPGSDPISRYTASFIATRAVKPRDRA